MNKHIELVKKWLADKDSVSLEELEANVDAAYYVAAAADCEAADAAYFAAAAADAAFLGLGLSVGYCIKRYEELTK